MRVHQYVPETVVDPPRRRFLQMFCGSMAETLV